MHKTLLTLLKDNSGDENISKMVWVCIVFTVAAILLLMITSAFENEIKTWYHEVIKSWFDDSGMNGQYTPAGKEPSEHGFLGDIISF